MHRSTPQPSPREYALTLAGSGIALAALIALGSLCPELLLAIAG
ncbi:hypothetical protein [Pseudomonas sp. 57B-090624]|nr:hypothetical protein [Pseudomonas sp. 57B-090624]